MLTRRAHRAHETHDALSWTRPATLALATFMLVYDVARVAALSGDAWATGRAALVVGVLLVPYFRLLDAGLRAERPVAARWTFSAVCLVNAVGLGVVGPIWVFTLSTVVVSALIVLRSTSALLLGLVVLVAVVAVTAVARTRPWGAVVSDDAFGAIWFVGCAVVSRTVQQVGLVWSVAGLCRLRSAREARTAAQRLRERARLAETIDAALADRLDRLVVLAEQVRSSMTPDRLQRVAAAADETLASMRDTVIVVRRARETPDDEMARQYAIPSHLRGRAPLVVAIVVHVAALPFPLLFAWLAPATPEVRASAALLWVVAVAVYGHLVTRYLRHRAPVLRAVSFGVLALAAGVASLAIDPRTVTLWWLPAVAALLLWRGPARVVLTIGCLIGYTASMSSGGGSGAYVLWNVVSDLVASGFVLGVLVASVALAAADDDLRTEQDVLVQRAADVERLRVSSRLHDLMGQSLTALRLKADLAQRMLEADPSSALAEFDDVLAIAQHQRADLAEALAETAPVTLDGELQRAVTLLRASGIAVTVDADAALCRKNTGDLLAWTVREATTNILRHADATAAMLTVHSPDEHTVTVDVENDGARPCVDSASPGTGLTGLARRAETARGDLRAEHRAGGVFHVTLTLPVDQQVATP